MVFIIFKRLFIKHSKELEKVKFSLYSIGSDKFKIEEYYDV